ncbi:MAG: exo-alpha-sialidase [Phycisphaeraceae bacterium]|nr:exo-alpha-sialidase [Phycisphaeraceae bacterium]
MMAGKLLAMIVVVIGMLAQVGLAATDEAQVTQLVCDGRPFNVAYPGDVWTEQDGKLVGKGEKNPLWSVVGLGKGDFRISARVCLQNQQKSAVAFMLDGNHFGFEGAQEEIFVNGQAFGGLSRLGPSADVFERGSWFDFLVTRTAGKLQYFINGRPVYEFDYGDKPIDKIGFYPCRATVQIKDWTIEGPITASTSLDNALSFTTVYLSNHEPNGHNTYRIPSIIGTHRGALLAFAEGRGSRSDASGNDLVMKRSTDGGRTWSAMRILEEDGDNVLGNPTPVVLRETGRVVFMYCRYQKDFHEKEARPGYEGEGVVRAFVIHSDDDGQSWSNPVEVTRGVKRPTDVTSIAVGPGVGIELRRGPHKGRILYPFNQGPWCSWKIYAVYSDDGGETWRYGQTAENSGDFFANEVQAVELDDGRIMLNARLQSNAARCRGVAYSDDGGETWSPVKADPQLPEPICQASFLRLTDPLDGYRGRLIFSNPASSSKRLNGTVRLSDDGGLTWPASRVLMPEEFGYSCLTVLPDLSIGCFFETWQRDESRPGDDKIAYRLMLARFPMGWLNSNRDGIACGPDLKFLDLAADTSRQVIVDKQDGQYLGHPTTVLLEDGKTMLVVYPMGHGEGQIVLKRSEDAGLTWSPRLPVPENWSTSKECPTIFRVTDAQGVRRLVLFSGVVPIRMSVSEDDGVTWSPLAPIGDFNGTVAMSSMVALGPGRYMALYHHHTDESGRRSLEILKTLSDDGGLTWSSPQIVTGHSLADLCEPGAVWSPDGKQLAVLMRENSRKLNSFVTFSDDRGNTWTPPVELPASLTGDRHVARYAPDGRLVIVFRDMAAGSATYGDFVAWVGAWQDMVEGRDGQCRVRLLDNRSSPYDTGYAGLEVLEDGTFVATTYAVLEAGTNPLVVSVRFNVGELGHF